MREIFSFFCAKRALRIVTYVIGGLGLIGGAYLVQIQVDGNFHPIVEGEAYRSNQPNVERLTDYVKKYGIKTIVNLRGASPGKKWYEDEVATAKTLGVNYLEFGMSSSKPLSAESGEKLIALLENAPKPILIHCKSGSDRTGLASALYIAAISKGGEKSAESQLSLFYGHFGFPLSPTYAMDRTFEILEPFLGYTDS